VRQTAVAQVQRTRLLVRCQYSCTLTTKGQDRNSLAANFEDCRSEQNRTDPLFSSQITYQKVTTCEHTEGNKYKSQRIITKPLE